MEEKMAEKTVANVVVRVTLDSTEEIIGANGMKALMNYAGMGHLIDNLPDYSPDKGFTDEDLRSIDRAFIEVLGMSGAVAVYRMVGKAAGRWPIKLGILDPFKDLPTDERLLKAIELIPAFTGRGEVTTEGDTIVYTNPLCAFCEGNPSTRPICSFQSGLMDVFIQWCGVTNMHAVETQCKAMGAPACRYEILPVEG
jgi:predicted hydrocarbon binding protein